MKNKVDQRHDVEVQRSVGGRAKQAAIFKPVNYNQCYVYYVEGAAD